MHCHILLWNFRIYRMNLGWNCVLFDPPQCFLHASVGKECGAPIVCAPGTRGILWLYHAVITLWPRQYGRHFADDIFNCIFLNESVRMSIKISLKFVFKSPINNIPELVQTMACRLVGAKPLSEPMMVRLPTHIGVTRPQWVIFLVSESTETMLLTPIQLRFGAGPLGYNAVKSLIKDAPNPQT